MRIAASIIVSILGSAALAGAGGADPGWLPSLSGDLALELQSDPARRRATKFGASTLPTFELALEAELLPHFGVEAEVVFEPSLGFVEEGEGPLGEGDLAIEALALHYAGERVFARGGKFTPRFGMAWDAAPGLFGAEFAEDYELTQRWGVELGFELFPALAGEQRLVASASFADTSLLAGSLGRERLSELRDEEDRAVSRSDAYTLTLEGEVAPDALGLRYHAAFAQHARLGESGLRERGVALGFELPLLEGSGYELVASFEHAWRFSVEAEAVDARVATLGLGLDLGHWSLALTGDARRLRGEEAGLDYAASTSIGYRFAAGPVLEVGWQVGREEGVRSHFVGVMLRREFSW